MALPLSYFTNVIKKKRPGYLIFLERKSIIPTTSVVVIDIKMDSFKCISFYFRVIAILRQDPESISRYNSGFPERFQKEEPHLHAGVTIPF